MWVSCRGIEEEDENSGVEEEEEDVEHCDLFANRVDLGLFEGHSSED